MRRPDFWNWPPFMTVRRHNRIVTEIIEQAQKAIDGEYDRATQAGRAQVHAFAVEANWNIFHGNSSGGVTNPRAYAALQQAEHMFTPDRTNLKEATDAAVSP